MARLSFVDPSALPAHFSDLPLHQNFQRVYAHSPAAMRAFMGVSGYVRERGGLDARLRELAILSVGVAARSAYVFAHHVKVALEAGVTAEEIRAIASGRGAEHAGLTPPERSAIALAADMTAGRDVADALFDAVRSALGDEQVMNLLFVVAHYVGMAALIGTLRIELEEGYQRYLAEFRPAFA